MFEKARKEMIMKKFSRLSITTVAVVLPAGCGKASYNDNPNFIQRADITSKNAGGITVEHSTWGKKIAFRYADEHCESMGKVATYLGASQQYGPDVISTWRCE
ncbi:MAG: hypothetical protein WAT23_12355 [Chromatiaceae bacterium]